VVGSSTSEEPTVAHPRAPASTVGESDKRTRL